MKQIEKITKGLLKLKSVEHKKPPTPNKKDLNKKFVLRFGRDGKMKIKEV